MEQTFLTELKVYKVRHLKDFTIALSDTERKHLILTGKNGSGKTSLLENIVNHLVYLVSDNFASFEKSQQNYLHWKSIYEKQLITNPAEANSSKRQVDYFKNQFDIWSTGCVAECNSIPFLREKYESGQFILAYFGDSRKIVVDGYKNIEKVDLKPVYGIKDKPSKNLGKYLVNLKSTQAFAQTKGDFNRAAEIEAWFNRFEGILRRIYHDDSLKLEFDIDTFQFSILTEGREPFAFNEMSMGYAAVFDIISDLIMRMESQHRYDLEGIVLIDEIETHLHVELQKEIVPILAALFPNLQFILTTHSPFILNSTKNAVVYDLEKNLLVEDGLTDLPYEGIIEGYFDADLLSQELRSKFEKYKALIAQSDLSDSDYAKIAELEYYLDEIPDYLAVDFSEEYSRLKAEFESRDRLE